MKKETKDIIKTVVSLTASIGVGAVVGNFAKMTTPDTVGKIGKVLIGLGSIVLSNMIGDMAGKYTDEKIDSTVEDVERMVEKMKQNQQEN